MKEETVLQADDLATPEAIAAFLEGIKFSPFDEVHLRLLAAIVRLISSRDESSDALELIDCILKSIVSYTNRQSKNRLKEIEANAEEDRKAVAAAIRSPIDRVMVERGCSFPEAVEFLANKKKLN